MRIQHFKEDTYALMQDEMAKTLFNDSYFFLTKNEQDQVNKILIKEMEFLSKKDKFKLIIGKILKKGVFYGKVIICTRDLKLHVLT